ncbi:(-)-alpha-terpineol synthase-like [Cornus florida]|uniref:(-)-alpha-terpineol synthase-like n=1 Tax=Cornus florida TaxID=4283 RepID=UPI002898B8E4|nr:(-)-alpha-terpineol synthase-like [Cornus florida]
MAEEGFWTEKDMKFITAWLQDLVAVGYQQPRLMAILTKGNRLRLWMARMRVTAGRHFKMAFAMLSSSHLCIFTARPHGRQLFSQRTSSKLCASLNGAKASTSIQTVVRRSGNYKPSIWEHHYLQSLSSVYSGEEYTRRAENLKKRVKMMLEQVMMDPLDQLELVDVLQRLGLSYHFKDEISKILEVIFSNNCNWDKWEGENLYATALQFRLLRQQGFHVPQDVFKSFMSENGKFKACHCGDTKGLLCLYEASYFSIEGESILEEAKDFTTRHLKKNLEQNICMDKNLAMQVSHSLELPLHWRMIRLENRWFIDVYERRPDTNPLLLEFAKLDFNMVQAKHLEEVKQVARWWKNIGFAEKLNFARDRLVENYFWSIGVFFEPQFEYGRTSAGKVNALITAIDDVYDVYGTLEELELFTDAVKRWDINAIDQLPYYMKLCFLGLYNSVNEMAYDFLKDEGSSIISFFKKRWAELCEAYLIEAKWYYSGYKPTLKEYLENACMSIAVPLMLVHAYFSIPSPTTKEALECLDKYPSIFQCSGMVLRLADDLGTSPDEMKRGDVPKSIQCYMYETGASEEEARDYIKHLIDETWKKMNEDLFSVSPFSKTFISMGMNFGRVAQCLYQYGDGHGVEDGETKGRVVSLLIEPIPLV